MFVYPDRKENMKKARGYGQSLKSDYRRFYGVYIGFSELLQGLPCCLPGAQEKGNHLCG